MEDNIIFLGTGGDSSTVGKQLRASGGIVLTLNNLQLHIDPGPGSLVRAMQYNVNIRNNTAILVSNTSIKSSNDLNAVIDAMTIGGLDRKGVLITNSVVVNGDDKFLPLLTRFHKNCIERVIILENNQKVGVEDIEIIAIPTKGQEHNGVGFKVISANAVITYTGDTKYSPDIINHYKDSDILILSSSSPGQTNNPLTLNTEEAIKIINKIKPKLAVITNFGLDMLKADPLYEARVIQRETGVQTIAAKDGMIITVGSFSASMRQRTLTSFSQDKLISHKENITIREVEVNNDVEDSDNQITNFDGKDQ